MHVISKEIFLDILEKDELLCVICLYEDNSKDRILSCMLIYLFSAQLSIKTCTLYHRLSNMIYKHAIVNHIIKECIE